MLNAMWWTVFRGGHWSEFTDFVSPALFDVIGGAEIAQQLKSLACWYWERDRSVAVREEYSAVLKQSGLRVELSNTRIGRFTRPEDGDEVLALFFHQLFARDRTLLDLRRASFRVGECLKWDPGPMCVLWDPAFLEAVRDVYAGFYRDDAARYQKGVLALGLELVSDVFSEHFRPDESGRTRFSMAEFRHAFHSVFVRCRDTHTRLHPNFIALGIYLGCLYEHLEELGGAYDVRAAFLRASGVP